MPADWVGKYFSGIVTANNAVIWIMEFSDDGSTWKRELTIRSANQKLEIPNDGYYKFTFKIAKNNAISNYTFKPMIADEVVYDTIGTGQPPALPNSNLTALEAEDRASLAEVVDSGAKNKFIPRSQTQAGITATVNSDNSLDVTWTAIGSSNEYCRINNDDLKLPVGTYVFSGLTESGDLNYYLHLEDSSGTVIGNIMPNTPNRCLEFKVTDATKNYKVYVAVMANSAAQSTAKKIYPMVCTKAAFGVSKAFVPYRPNWDLVCTNLNKLKNGATIRSSLNGNYSYHGFKIKNSRGSGVVCFMGNGYDNGAGVISFSYQTSRDSVYVDKKMTQPSYVKFYHDANAFYIVFFTSTKWDDISLSGTFINESDSLVEEYFSNTEVPSGATQVTETAYPTA